jgi:hypothetical protein
MTISEDSIREIRLEHVRFSDGSADLNYRKLRIVVESGSHFVIERIPLASLRELANAIQHKETVSVVVPRS